MLSLDPRKRFNADERSDLVSLQVHRPAWHHRLSRRDLNEVLNNRLEY